MSAAQDRTGIAFVGCGFVSDLYMETLPNWTDVLDHRGVWDIDAARLEHFTTTYSLHKFGSLDELLADPAVEIIVNLTNPSQHYAISKAALEAGKHVYSEKPLAMELAQAEELVALGAERGLQVVSAPSSVLGDAAQRLWEGVRSGQLGAPRLAYAEIDDGMVHRIGYETWQSVSGAYWPAKDEFSVGCTLEHAGYALTWMVAMFGSVTEVTSVAALLIPEKGPHTPDAYVTPDFSCALLKFENGVVGRLTNSIIAPHDHHFRVFCDEGSFSAEEIWDFGTPVKAVPLATSRLARQLEKRLGWEAGRNLNKTPTRKVVYSKRGHPMDFALGPAEMAQAIRAGRAPRLAGDFSLHITEVSLAIQYPEIYGTPYAPKSRSQAITPML